MKVTVAPESNNLPHSIRRGKGRNVAKGLISVSLRCGILGFLLTTGSHMLNCLGYHSAIRRPSGI